MTWRELGTLDDRNDAGGDYQVGKAYSRRFTRPAGHGEHLVVEVHYYTARDDRAEDGARLNEYWVGLEIDWTLCTDPARPGDTELRADMRSDTTGRQYTYRTMRDAERRAMALAKRLRPRDIDGLLRKVRL